MQDAKSTTDFAADGSGTILAVEEEHADDLLNLLQEIGN
jgi:hypothetical protein